MFFILTSRGGLGVYECYHNAIKYYKLANANQNIDLNLMTHARTISAILWTVTFICAIGTIVALTEALTACKNLKNIYTQYQAFQKDHYKTTPLTT